MQFSLTVYYILDKRLLIHVLGNNRMYDPACFTSITNVEKTVMHYSTESMKKITFGLIERIQVLHCKSIKHGATKHHKHVSMPAYNSLLASVILRGGKICTHKTIPLAIWILLILYARRVSTQLTLKKTPGFDLIPFSYIKSVEIN